MYKTPFYLSKIFKISILLLSIEYSQGQSISNTNDQLKKIVDSLDAIYGNDPLLHNGRIYYAYYPQTVEGHQYLYGKQFEKGVVTIRGEIFDNANLNYDIYNQELLLQIKTLNGLVNTIAISKVWLNSFSINNLKFIYKEINGYQKRLYQVLGTDSIKLMFFYKKNLTTKGQIGIASLSFIPYREQYIYRNQQLYKFHNKRSFVHIFKKETQSAIRKYIRTNKIMVNKSPDTLMEKLINYCNNPIPL